VWPGNQTADLVSRALIRKLNRKEINMTIKYHFFGREIQIDRGLSNRKALNDGLAKVGFDENRSLFLNQIHSDKVCIIDSPDKIYGDQNLPKADAIVTNQPNINIGIVTADCAPILFFCARSNIIAAAHAGWKGAKAGIVKNTIMAMKGLGATDIQAVIGPMIQQESYEVSQEFYQEFLQEDKENNRFFMSGKESNKFQFDLNDYVKDRITEAKVENIQNLRTDTYADKDNYFSYRRSTHKNEVDCGRNVAVIGSVC